MVYNIADNAWRLFGCDGGPPASKLAGHSFTLMGGLGERHGGCKSASSLSETYQGEVFIFFLSSILCHGDSQIPLSYVLIAYS